MLNPIYLSRLRRYHCQGGAVPPTQTSMTFLIPYKQQAIQMAHQQPYHFKELLSVIAGFIFIGTPHSRSPDESVWKTVSLLPRLKFKNVAEQSLGSKDVSRLAEICARFEDAEFDRPILNMYESCLTVTGRTFRTGHVMLSFALRNLLICHEAE